jgi:hypothetical protein
MATTQRERNAAQAREKMDARREEADGAAGWVASAPASGIWRASTTPSWTARSTSGTR